MKKIIQILILLGVTQLGFNQSALHFDGVDDYVQTYYQGILFGGDRTFEAWIFVDTPASTDTLAILDYGSSASGGRNTFCVKGDKSLSYISGGATNSNISSASNAITPGQWTHVAFVKSLTRGFLYVNGIQVGTGSLTNVNTPTPFSGERLKIGERVAGGSNLFKGRIDEVRIWDKARTSSEILSNMNAEYCQIQHWRLEAYYRFNEGIAGGTNLSDTMVIDYARIFDGKLNGFALTGTTSNFVTGPTLTSGYSKTFYKDSICSSFTTITGKTFTTTGFYYDTLKNSTFCDSLIEYNLTITDLDDSIYKSGTRLISHDTWAQHQWVDCNNGFATLSGETNFDFTPTASGQYAVIVSRGPCTDTSACLKVNFTDVKKNNFESISIYPNPAKNILTINSEFSLIESEISIYSINGKLIQPVLLSNKSLDISELSTGLYFLSINSKNGSKNVKFIKAK